MVADDAFQVKGVEEHLPALVEHLVGE